MANEVKLTWQNLNAAQLAQLFVATAKEEGMRVGHRHGGTQGHGIIPYDTGALQNSIRMSVAGQYEAQVIIGSNDVDYAEFLEFMVTQTNGALNLHRGFVENYVLGFFAQKVASQLQTNVSAKIERGQQ